MTMSLSKNNPSSSSAAGSKQMFGVDAVQKKRLTMKEIQDARLKAQKSSKKARKINSAGKDGLGELGVQNSNKNNKNSSSDKQNNKDNNNDNNNSDDSDLDEAELAKLIESAQNSKNSKDNLEIQGTQEELDLALLSGDVVSAARVISAGASVHHVDEHGWTPLRKAVRASSGRTAMVKMLLRYRADPMQLNQLALVTASAWGNFKAVNLLLEARGNVENQQTVNHNVNDANNNDGNNPDNPRQSQSGWEHSPLALACQFGHRRVVELLLSHRADVNAPDLRGNDPLMISWDYGHQDLVFYLVERGAVLKSAKDWGKLAQVPAMALKIAEGISSRQEAKGLYRPNVTVPINALCDYVRSVPVAAIVLLDKVLALPPQGEFVPKLAKMNSSSQSDSIATTYQQIAFWNPRECPELRNFVQFAGGSGGGSDFTENLVDFCNVEVKCFHQRNAICTEMLFSILETDLMIFHSKTAQAIVHHTWQTYAKSRFYLDLLIQVLAVVAAMAVVVSSFDDKRVPDVDDLDHMRAHTNPIVWMWINSAFIIYFLLTSCAELTRQFCYFRLTGVRNFFDPKDLTNLLSETGITLMRLLEFLISIPALFSWIIDARGSDSEGTLPPGPRYKNYYPYFAIYSFYRWISLMLHFRWLPSRIGVHFLSFLYVLAKLGPFLVAYIVLMITFITCTFVALEGSNESPAELSAIFLMYTSATLSHLDTGEHGPHEGTLVQGLKWCPIMWAMFSAFFLGAVMTGILINILVETWEFLRVDVEFQCRKHQSHICFRYLLSIQFSSAFHKAYCFRNEDQLYYEEGLGQAMSGYNQYQQQGGSTGVNSNGNNKGFELNERDLNNEYYSQIVQDNDKQDMNGNILDSKVGITTKKNRSKPSKYSLPMRHAFISFLLAPMECILSWLFPDTFQLPPHHISHTNYGSNNGFNDSTDFKLWICSATDDPYNLDFRTRQAERKGVLGWTNQVSREVVSESAKELEILIKEKEKKFLGGLKRTDNAHSQLAKILKDHFAKEGKRK